ncbi:MAG: polysaccharide biosynthesis protein [Bacillota bacterium]
MPKSTLYKKTLRTIEFMIVDGFSITLTYLATVLLFYLLDITISFTNIAMILPVIIALKLLFYAAFGLYSMLLDHFGFEDAFKVFLVVIISNTFLMFFFMFTNVDFINWSAFIFISPLEILLLLAPRIAKRAINYIRMNLDWNQALGTRTLIVGAGDGGELVLKEIYRNKKLLNIPIAFIDDNYNKIGSKLSGVKIVGPISNLSKYIHLFHIEEVIIAIKNISYKKLQELVTVISEEDVKIKRLPIMEEMDKNEKPKIMDVKVEDLLSRGEIELNNDDIEAFIEDEVVLVTGGGGSIGSELSRQIAELNPKTLIIFDIYENNAYDIQMEISRMCAKKKCKNKLEVIIGSVYNEARLKRVFETFKPTIVLHAAAYKHVPLMEDSPQEAVRTNVLGTYNVAKLSQEFGVKNMVLVSSDKAVRPTNIMGATKRYAELIIEYFDKQSENTNYSAVRFGNVLGSNGSVIPLFKKQIEDGGPVTVTHPEITRYFMTIPEAVSLILQSAVYAKGGEIFVLDMGEPMKIKDLAEKMIKLVGLKPHRDIDIIYTGLRPGEKLYEELLVDTTNNIKTPNRKIFIEDSRSNGKVIFEKEAFTQVIKDIETMSTLKMKETIAAIIPSYTCDKGKTHKKTKETK